MKIKGEYTNIIRQIKYSHKLDVLRIDLDGGGEEVRQIDQEAAGAGAPDFEEDAFVAVEGAADDADLTAAHGRGQLAGHVVGRIGRGVDGNDEAGHIVAGNNHRLTICPALEVAVLKCGSLADYRIQDRACGVDEKQVRHERHHPAFRLAAMGCQCPFHRGEDLDVQF